MSGCGQGQSADECDPESKQQRSLPRTEQIRELADEEREDDGEDAVGCEDLIRDALDVGWVDMITDFEDVRQERCDEAKEKRF
jgi:peptide subunit release factor 1 (eRF1)